MTIEKELGMLTLLSCFRGAGKIYRTPIRFVAAESQRRTAGSTSGEISLRTRAW
jgi:hypothetical protein